MSFSRIEILEEFEEAARLGRHDRIALAGYVLEARAEWRKARRVERDRAHGVKPRVVLPPPPPRLVYLVAPVAVQGLPCPTCGAPCEIRPGCRRVVHLGPPTHCAKRAA